MINLTIPAVALAIIVFGLISWNLLIPFNSQKNKDFMNLTKYFIQDQYKSNTNLQQIADSPMVGPPIKEGVIDRIIASNDNNFEVGPRVLEDSYPNPSQVTLTFYVQYGNQQSLPDLIDTLRSYNLKKAVFFVDKNLADDRPLAIQAIQYNGYKVITWNNLTEFSHEYPPSVYRGIVLSDKNLLSSTSKDDNAATFLKIALHYNDASIVAFTPKVMLHKVLLEEILKENGKTLIFTDSNEASKSATINVYSYPQTITTIADSSNGQQSGSGQQMQQLGYVDPLLNVVNIGSESATKPIHLTEGVWTMQNLQRSYPYAIASLQEKGNNSYLILNSILVDKKASLTLDHVSVFLKSSSLKDSNSVMIEVRGKALFNNSSVTSWDSTKQEPDIDGYHSRPFLVARNGGTINIYNSEITELGYSIGGLKDTSRAIAAISYFNTSNFEIYNSKIAYNYYGIHADHATKFSITGNEIYGNVGPGIDSYANSSSFVIDSNYVHDNWNQGIICALQCTNVTITNNLVEYNAEGIGLHWLSNSSIIKDNIIRYNAKYGIFIQKNSFNNTIQDNIIIGNNDGIGLLGGSSENTLLNNTIFGNNQQDILYSDQNSIQTNNVQNTIHVINDPEELNWRIKSFQQERSSHPL